MKNLIVLYFLVSCVHMPYQPPKIEQCGLNEDDTASCVDKRLQTPAYEKATLEMTNYLCTNPADYNSIYEWANTQWTERVSCEKKLASCHCK